jgi:D-arabinose 1-dehydrogenase-like Zn-dependent alcohol dehydrogenase
VGRAQRSLGGQLTREDAIGLLTLAARVQIRTHVQPYAFSDANHALTALRSGTLTGAAALSKA